MGFVALGLSNQEIAEHLVVTPATAKTACQPGDDQASRPRPRAARGLRLSVRAGDRPGGWEAPMTRTLVGA